jgi:hypothetical protein
MALRVKYKDVLWEMPLAAKVFNRKKWLILDAGNEMAEAIMMAVLQF